MSELKRQLPNILTIMRLPLAILCVYFAISLNPVSLSISLFFFLLASATDFLDGFLARKWNIVSNFGKIWDPIADKTLILGVLFVFTYEGIIPIIMTLLIAIREIGLTIIRLLLLPKKVVLASRYSGKIKTFSQVGVLITIYVILIFNDTIKLWINVDWISNFILFLIVWKVGITIYSGMEFLHFNRKAIEKLG